MKYMKRNRHFSPCSFTQQQIVLRGHQAVSVYPLGKCRTNRHISNKSRIKAMPQEVNKTFIIFNFLQQVLISITVARTYEVETTEALTPFQLSKL